MRRTAALPIVVLIVLLFSAVPRAAGATVPPGADGDGGDAGVAATATTIDNSFLDTKRDLTECLNNSINLPDCGREPTSLGDRGGALQLVTFSLMGLGLVIVGWRVTRAIRARDAALATSSRADHQVSSPH